MNNMFMQTDTRVNGNKVDTISLHYSWLCCIVSQKEVACSVVINLYLPCIVFGTERVASPTQPTITSLQYLVKMLTVITL